MLISSLLATCSDSRTQNMALRSLAALSSLVELSCYVSKYRKLLCFNELEFRLRFGPHLDVISCHCWVNELQVGDSLPHSCCTQRDRDAHDMTDLFYDKF